MYKVNDMDISFIAFYRNILSEVYNISALRDVNSLNNGYYLCPRSSWKFVETLVYQRIWNIYTL